MITPLAGFVLLAAARDRREPEPALLAARLLGAYDSLQARAHHYLERMALDENIAGLRELLGEPAYQAAYAEGTALDAARAVALLRGDDDGESSPVRSSS
jgi:hypothetical protein